MKKSLNDRLAILSDAAKYDASCASSGTTKRNSSASGGLTGRSARKAKTLPQVRSATFASDVTNLVRTGRAEPAAPTRRRP